MTKEKHNCDNVNCNHNNTKGLCCLFNPDDCKYRQLEKENAELKEKLGDVQMQKAGEKSDLVWKLKTANEQKADQLSKAKELLKQLVDIEYTINIPKEKIISLRVKAEQFLSEVEK